MTKRTFERALSWVLAHEGGYVDHPKDPGGATNQGITQKTYDAYRRSIRGTLRSVRDIDPIEIRAIYERDYWKPVGAEYIRPGIAYALFDYAVNSGVSRAVREVQGILDVKIDGIAGSNTIGAINGTDEAQLIRALCERRMAFLKRLKTWSTFGRGWTRRVIGSRPGAQADDTGVLDRAIMLALDKPEIPSPPQANDGAGAKADSEDTKRSAWVAAILKDPVEALAAAVPGLTALVTADGPVGYAVAFALLIIVLAGLVAARKRGLFG